MKWAKTKAQLIIMNPDPGVKEQCFEEYDIITADGTTIEDGKTKKKIKGEKKASASDTFTEWVTYPLAQDSETYPKKLFPDLEFKKLPALDKEGRRRYEIFCGGFLYYHDVIFKKYQIKDLYLKYYGENHDKHKVFEHKIYFEWFGEGDTKLDETSTEIAKKVTIYITPTPSSLNPDPPDPPGGPPPY